MTGTGDAEIKILFLDFDGVMHPYRCSVDECFCHLGLLEGWLRLRPAVSLVISSSWREVHPLDEMVSYFSKDIGPRILGATPRIRRDGWAQFDGEPQPERFEREIEVRRWLHENGISGHPWAALDDQATLYRPNHRRLVLCEPSVGLTQRELVLVDAVLGIKV